MFHFLNSVLLVGAFVLVIGAVYAAKVLLRIRKEETAPFRNYFSTEYDRDLLRYSAMSEDEEWQADRHPRTAAFIHRDSGDRE
jgi:hypothetical protein